MLNNSGTQLFLIIFIASAVLLMLLLVVLALVGHKKPKGKGTAALKGVTLVLALGTAALAVITTLSYYNVTGINLQYGNFSSEDGSNTTLSVHRHTLSKSQNGEQIGKDVAYTLENNTLTFTIGGTTYSYEVKDFGTKLYQGETLVYKYRTN